MRYTADALVLGLRRHGHSVTLHTVSDQLTESGIAGSSTAVPSKVNLFGINPDHVVALLRSPHEDPLLGSRLNVIVPFWEVTALPRAWRATLESMDVVVAPTAFVADVLASAHLNVPILPQQVVVDVPPASPDRARFGFAADVLVFGFAFGSEAAVERKNPFGVVEAFLKAFPSEPDVRLAIRINPTGPSSAGVVARLSEVAHGDPRVLYVTEPLSYDEMLTFYASLDAYVSLHRAEGLGLGLMESMAVGTPVIATGWSGGTGFMSSDDSLLVGYDLIPVSVGPDSPYRPSVLEGPAVWAEPRIDEAVAAMRTIREQPLLRSGLGVAARTAYERALARAAADDLGRLLGSFWDLRGPESVGHDERATQLGSQPAWPSRSILARTWRKAGRLLRGER